VDARRDKRPRLVRQDKTTVVRNNDITASVLYSFLLALMVLPLLTGGVHSTPWANCPPSNPCDHQHAASFASWTIAFVLILGLGILHRQRTRNALVEFTRDHVLVRNVIKSHRLAWTDIAKIGTVDIQSPFSRSSAFLPGIGVQLTDGRIIKCRGAGLLTDALRRELPIPLVPLARRHNVELDFGRYGSLGPNG
jgi:hypothetical protein